MFQIVPRLVVMFLLGLVIAGCQQNPNAKAPDQTAETEAASTPKPDRSHGTPEKTSGKNTLTPTAGSIAATKSTYTEADFLADDVVGLIVGHPKRVAESPLYQTMKATGFLTNMDEQMSVIGLKPEEIERMTVVIDQFTINTAASTAGLEVPDFVPEAGGSSELQNNLIQVGLAFHNYHETAQRFPRADGDSDGSQTGLSWRVYLLPYLDEAELYESFHLDEPWDSEHNKTLIEKMPKFFRSPGVKATGKTSMHVFVGPHTPFDGETGKSVRDFTDGLGDTIMAVMAGADTAEVWTKPGGLKFDAAAPKNALGKIDGRTFKVLLSDGSVRSLPLDISDETFASLIQLDDLGLIDISLLLPPQMVLTVVARLAKSIDRAATVKSILTVSDDETVNGQTMHTNGVSAVWFPDDTTMVCGVVATVRKMIATKQSGRPGTPAVLSQLDLGADLTLAFDLESQSAIFKQLIETSPIMGLGLIQQIRSASLQINITGKPGDRLLELVANTLDEQTAKSLSGMATLGLEQAKQVISQMPRPMTPSDAANVEAQIRQRLIKSAAINQSGSRIEFRVSVPEGFDQLPELMKPAMQQAQAAAEKTRKKNNLKQIGLAFHNYEAAYQNFPGAGRDGAAIDHAGLSWRVHLLPLLDAYPLYKKFKIDEPWDSENNKALIEQMPDIFKSDGVTEPGKTGIHVFTGPGAPFAKNQAPKTSSFTDGLVMTILVVEAGPDTAAIWTKPGGLDFDPKNPLKALGQLVGEKFLVLLADGSVRTLPADINPELLLRLIQFQDGKPLDDF